MAHAGSRVRSPPMGVLLFAMSTPLLALSCRSLVDSYVSSSEHGGTADNRTLFHGRVTRTTGPREAEVQVLELFSGKADAKVLIRKASSDRIFAASLSPGEEALFSPDEVGQVHICSKQHIFPGDLERLRRAKAKRNEKPTTAR